MASKGKTGRFVRLAGMTAQVAASYAKTRLSSAWKDAESAAKDRSRALEESGERIAETLGELKGAAMKLGQMASMQTDFLPKEVSQALTRLQKEAPPIPTQVIKDQIERELGRPVEALFSWFDEAPFASASIGQVHRATMDDGRQVVVKVQYPGVDESVGSDLVHLRLALRASGLLKGASRDNLNQLFAEIKARLKEELDYCNEADNVRRFRDFHQKHPFIVVPKVVGERSSQRVLTLEYEPGDNINALDDKGYDQPTRDKIGAHIFELVLSQIFELQAIHADPNAANFAFRPDGKIVIYDFGCVKKLDPNILKAYAGTLLSAVREDYAAVERGMLALGARRPDGPPVEADYYRTWRNVLLQPFLKEGGFDYGASTIHDDVKRLLPGLMRRITSFQAPIEIVFIDRVAAGQYGNLRKVRARGHFFEQVMRYMEPAASV